MNRTLSTRELKRQADIIGSQSPDFLGEYTQRDIHTLIRDLHLYQVELELQNDELRRSQEVIEALRQRYFERYNLAPIGYFTMTETGIILEANQIGAAMLGVDKISLSNKPFSAFLLKGAMESWFACLNRSARSDDSHSCQIELKPRKAPSIWVELHCRVLQLESKAKLSIACSMLDITQRKHFEHELIRSRDALEKAVHDATAELVETNRVLEKELIERRKDKKALKAQAVQLKRRTERLEKANTAFKVLLDQREADRCEIEEKVSVNVNELILPFIQIVKQGRLNQLQQEHLESLESALHALVSPMARTLTLDIAHLTACEIQVAELVRQGMVNIIKENGVGKNSSRLRRQPRGLPMNGSPVPVVLYLNCEVLTWKI